MENSKLSKNEMKKIMGGLVFGGDTGPKTTSCSTTCSNGQTIAITECKGVCYAKDKEYVSCTVNNVLDQHIACESQSSGIVISSVDRSVLLISSAASMLAQANAVPQSELSLLR